jgi:hypothetical protein
MQDGMIYRINYVSGGGPLRVSGTGGGFRQRSRSMR